MTWAKQKDVGGTENKTKMKLVKEEIRGRGRKDKHKKLQYPQKQMKRKTHPNMKNPPKIKHQK